MDEGSDWPGNVAMGFVLPALIAAERAGDIAKWQDHLANPLPAGTKIQQEFGDLYRAGYIECIVMKTGVGEDYFPKHVSAAGQRAVRSDDPGAT
jgi:hypothetical protein